MWIMRELVTIGRSMQKCLSTWLCWRSSDMRRGFVAFISLSQPLKVIHVGKCTIKTITNVEVLRKHQWEFVAGKVGGRATRPSGRSHFHVSWQNPKCITDKRTGRYVILAAGSPRNYRSDNPWMSSRSQERVVSSFLKFNNDWKYGFKPFWYNLEIAFCTRIVKGNSVLAMI